MAFDLRPMSVGTEVLGCDLAALTVGDSNQLEAAFASFGLLVFRDQVLTATELVEFARRLAPSLTETEVEVEERSHSSSTPGAWQGGNSFSTTPEMGMVAQCVSGDGGDMSFASLTAAFESLAGTTQRALEGLSAVHRSADSAEATHPMVIRHPISGSPAVYVNPANTVSVVDFDEHAGQQLLNELFLHCQSEDCVETVRWEPGTVMMWDHRAMWHFDRSAPGANALFATVGLAGTPLAPAVRPDPADPSIVQRARATIAGGIITAAMLGMAEVLEPERVRQDIEIVSEAPDREPLDDDLDFGGLPPLD